MHLCKLNPAMIHFVVLVQFRPSAENLKTFITPKYHFRPVVVSKVLMEFYLIVLED